MFRNIYTNITLRHLQRKQQTGDFVLCVADIPTKASRQEKRLLAQDFSANNLITDTFRSESIFSFMISASSDYT